MGHESVSPNADGGKNEKQLDISSVIVNYNSVVKFI